MGGKMGKYQGKSGNGTWLVGGLSKVQNRKRKQKQTKTKRGSANICTHAQIKTSTKQKSLAKTRGT